MKYQIKLLSFFKYLFIVTFFAACSGGNAETEAPQDSSYYKNAIEDDYYEEEATATESKNQSSPSSKPLDIQPMLIKNGELSIKSDNVKKWRSGLDKKLKKHKAYIVNENQHSSSYEIRNDITIRVPSVKFDSLLQDLEDGDGMIANKNIRVQDVTAEYLDLAGRLKTRKEVLERYRTLIGKASNVKDIIEIEEAARQVQEEIEAAEGRMKYLKNQSSFSTINLNVYQALKYHHEIGFGEKLIDAFVAGWQGFLIFLVGIAHAWVLILMGTIVFLLVRRRFFKKNDKKKTVL